MKLNGQPKTQEDVFVIHQKQMDEANAKRRTRNIDHIRNTIQVVNSIPLTNDVIVDGLARANMIRVLLDGARDIDAECGYPTWLTAWHYHQMYDREGISRRVVHCEPEETWAFDPIVYEDDDDATETEFERVWKTFAEEYNVWHYLQRADILSGVGQYGILLLGIDDGKPLSEPVDGVNNDGSYEDAEPGSRRIIYMRPFAEEVLMIRSREKDETSPRYGQPISYAIQFRDYPNWGLQVGESISVSVHWSRVIHLADNRLMSEVFGDPRMKDVWNRLYDLRKAYSSTGEALWKGAFPGYSFEVNPELADKNIEFDKDAIRLEMEKFSNSLQRYMATQGVTVKSLAPQFVDPSNAIETILKAIAISKAIPYRILFGTEEARLAGQSDTRAWNKRLARRQSKYVTPMIIRPFIDRLIGIGILPRPEKYRVEWPDLNALTDQDKAQVASTMTQAISTYVQSGADQLLPPMTFLTTILGLTREEAEAALEEAEELMAEEQAQQEEEQAMQGGGFEGDETPQGEEEDAEQQPAMNTGGRKSRRPFVSNEFEESEHPRDEDGKWTEGGGSDAKESAVKAKAARDSKMHRTANGEMVHRNGVADMVIDHIGRDGWRLERVEKDELTRLTIIYADANPNADVEDIKSVVTSMYEYGQSSVSFNEPLRKDLEPNNPIKNLQRGLAALPPVKGTVYRGTAMPATMLEGVKEGAVISDKGFVSTSLNEEVSRGFLWHTPPGEPPHVRVMMTIEDDVGLGREFGRGFMAASEEEVIYPPSTKFKVLGREEKEMPGGKSYISLRVSVVKG